MFERTLLHAMGIHEYFIGKQSQCRQAKSTYIFVLSDPDLHLFTAVHIEVIGANNLTLKIDQVEIYLPLFVYYLKSSFFIGKVGGLTDLSNLIKLRGHPEGGLGTSSHGILSHMDRGSAPQWTVQPPNELSFSNSSGAKLECMASGNPQPTIEWFQEDQLIAQNLHGLRMVMPNGTLYFPAFT